MNEARAQVSDNALGGHRGFVSVVNALPALRPQHKRDRVLTKSKEPSSDTLGVAYIRRNGANGFTPR
jgi:hypothetical protein